MTNNEIVTRALANTGIAALNEMQQAVLDAGTTKDMVLLSPTGSGKTLAFLLPLLPLCPPLAVGGWLLVPVLQCFPKLQSGYY